MMVKTSDIIQNDLETETTTTNCWSSRTVGLESFDGLFTVADNLNINFITFS